MDNKKNSLTREIVEILMILDDNCIDVDSSTNVINMVLGNPNKEKELLEYLRKENDSGVLLTEEMIINSTNEILKN